MPKTFVNNNEWSSYDESYTKFTANDYANVKYTSKGLRDAVNSCIDKSEIKNGTGILNSLPEAENSCLLCMYKSEKGKNDSHSYISTGYGYYIQLFYDFRIRKVIKADLNLHP